jgi:hypothetical protein
MARDPSDGNPRPIEIDVDVTGEIRVDGVAVTVEDLEQVLRDLADRAAKEGPNIGDQD